MDSIIRQQVQTEMPRVHLWYPARPGKPLPVMLHISQGFYRRLLEQTSFLDPRCDDEQVAVLWGKAHKTLGDRQPRYVVTIEDLEPILPDRAGRDHVDFNSAAKNDARNRLLARAAGEGSDFAACQIVGSVHTHPGYGIFFSNRDVECLQRSHFRRPWHVGMVIDPIRRLAGFFFWDGPNEIDPRGADWREYDLEAVIGPPLAEKYGPRPETGTSSHRGESFEGAEAPPPRASDPFTTTASMQPPPLADERPASWEDEPATAPPPAPPADPATAAPTAGAAQNGPPALIIQPPRYPDELPDHGSGPPLPCPERPPQPEREPRSIPPGQVPRQVPPRSAPPTERPSQPAPIVPPPAPLGNAPRPAPQVPRGTPPGATEGEDPPRPRGRPPRQEQPRRPSRWRPRLVLAGIAGGILVIAGALGALAFSKVWQQRQEQQDAAKRLEGALHDYRSWMGTDDPAGRWVERLKVLSDDANHRARCDNDKVLETGWSPLADFHEAADPCHRVIPAAEKVLDDSPRDTEQIEAQLDALNSGCKLLRTWHEAHTGVDIGHLLTVHESAYRLPASAPAATAPPPVKGNPASAAPAEKVPPVKPPPAAADPPAVPVEPVVAPVPRLVLSGGSIVAGQPHYQATWQGAEDSVTAPCTYEQEGTQLDLGIKAETFFNEGLAICQAGAYHLKSGRCPAQIKVVCP